jgi:hypothetical protein
MQSQYQKHGTNSGVLDRKTSHGDLSFAIKTFKSKRDSHHEPRSNKHVFEEEEFYPEIEISTHSHRHDPVRFNHDSQTVRKKSTRKYPNEEEEYYRNMRSHRRKEPRRQMKRSVSRNLVEDLERELSSLSRRSSSPVTHVQVNLLERRTPSKDSIYLRKSQTQKHLSSNRQWQMPHNVSEHDRNQRDPSRSKSNRRPATEQYTEGDRNQH